MTLFVLVIFGCYGLLLIFLMMGWWRAVIAKAGIESLSHSPFISVIIPVRNEGDTLPVLLQNLAKQTYPRNRFEVLVVDDHSTDDTHRVAIESLIASGFSGKCISLPAEKNGKKAAITCGVNLAQGEWIITTDADCRVEPGWLETMRTTITPKRQLVVGAVCLAEQGSFFKSLQAMEFASLVGSGVATLGWGIPSMCNGANLAFKKEAFLSVSGYEGNEQIASGDDEFLLRKVSARYPDGIGFNGFPQGAVEAAPSPTLHHFISQRIRWASKWTAHGFGFSFWLALFIFSFHVTVLFIPVMIYCDALTGWQATALVAFRMVFEAAFLFPVLTFCKRSFNPISFLVLQFVYPVYAVCFGLAANFLRTEWRGRKI